MVIGLMLLLVLSGCATNFERKPLSDKPHISSLPNLAMPEKAIGMDTGEDTGDDVISTQGNLILIPTVLEDSDPLPSFRVPWMSFVDSPLQSVLQAMVSDTKVPLSLVWDNPSAKIGRTSVTMSNLVGDLTSVLNKLAESYGFYWRYKNGMLQISIDRQYITQVPPVADLYDSLPIMVKTLGGTDVFLDRSNRMITFRAGSQAFARIKAYLNIIRKDRALIVYDTYIWEVNLNDGSKMGIDWGGLTGNAANNSMKVASKSGADVLRAGLVNAVSGGTGLALSFAGSRMSMNVLLDFLESQGTINSLSQPKLQLLSGGRASLKDEVSTTYISRVGSPYASSGNVMPGSVETSQVKTGVSLEVSADISDGTIYSDIVLRVSDLMAMNEAVVSGVSSGLSNSGGNTVIKLPQTSTREVNTQIRAKPGDTILLAGIQYDKFNGTLNTGMGILRSNQSAVQRNELVIVMRPRIKYFVPKGGPDR
jgi:hypothetical protein